MYYWKNSKIFCKIIYIDKWILTDLQSILLFEIEFIKVERVNVLKVQLFHNYEIQLRKCNRKIIFMF